MKRQEKGSVELIVMGLIAALIVVLAIPLLTNVGKSSKKLDTDKSEAVTAVPAQH